MTTTRKQLILTNYIKITNELKTVVKDAIFPSMEEFDIVDFVFLINLHFSNDDYNTKIKELIELKNISMTDETFESVCKIIIPFIKLIKSL